MSGAVLLCLGRENFGENGVAPFEIGARVANLVRATVHGSLDFEFLPKSEPDE